MAPAAVTPARHRGAMPPPPSGPPPTLPPPPPVTPFGEHEDFITFGGGFGSDMEESPINQVTKIAGQKRKRGEMESSDDLRSRDIILARGTPWAAQVPWQSCRNAAEMLHEEVLAFDKWMSPTREEHECRLMVIELIRRAIRTMWPDADVRTFGSQDTQLYLPQGDIDLVVLSKKMESSLRADVLRQIAALLRRHNLATDIVVVGKAKVPIVKFVCIQGRYHVDISINLTNGITAAQYVNRWMDHEPALRPLVMVIKQFLSQRGLSEVFSGGLGSYSIILMCISFLQLHPKIQRGEIDAMQNLGVLLVDMLELYGINFGYDATGISVNSGGYVPKRQMSCWQGGQRNPRGGGGLVMIEDPQDPTNDISRGSFNMGAVRIAIEGVYNILTGELCRKGNELIEQRRQRQNRRRPDPSDGESSVDEDEVARRELMGEAAAPPSYKSKGDSLLQERDSRSLLGTFLGISKEVVKARRQIKDLYDSGRLQSMLGRPQPGQSPEPGPSHSTNAKSTHTRFPSSDAPGPSRARQNGASRSDASRQANSGVVSDVVHADGSRDRSASVDILDEDELAMRSGVPAASWGHGGGGGAEFSTSRLSQGGSASQSRSQSQNGSASQSEEGAKKPVYISIRGSAAAAKKGKTNGTGTADEPITVDDDDDRQDSRYHVVAGADSARPGERARSRAASVVSIHSTAPSSFVSDDSDRDSHSASDDSNASASFPRRHKGKMSANDGIMLPTISDASGSGSATAVSSRAGSGTSTPQMRARSEKSLKRQAFWNAKGNVSAGRVEGDDDDVILIENPSREGGTNGVDTTIAPASKKVRKEQSKKSSASGSSSVPLATRLTERDRRAPIKVPVASAKSPRYIPPPPVDNTPYRTGAPGWTENTPASLASAAAARANGAAKVKQERNDKGSKANAYGMRPRSTSPGGASDRDGRSASPYVAQEGVDDTTFRAFDESLDTPAPKMPNSNRKARRLASGKSIPARKGSVKVKNEAKSPALRSKGKGKEGALGSAMGGKGKGKGKAAGKVNPYGMAVVPAPKR